MRYQIMNISVNRLNSINLDFYQKDNRKRNFTNNQNEKFDILEDFDLIMLDNKEKNKQDLEEAAKLIAIIQSDESGDFEKAFKKHLLNKSNNTQDHHNKGVLELISLIQDFVSVTVINTSRNFCNKVSNLFNENFVTDIGSAISDIGRFCCDLCDAMSTIRNNRLEYSEVSY